jgi:formate/nitrite transporter FocA (FNT family)
MQNTMYMLVGLWSGRITVKSVLANWGNCTCVCVYIYISIFGIIIFTHTHTHTHSQERAHELGYRTSLQLSRMRGNRILYVYQTYSYILYIISF